MKDARSIAIVGLTGAGKSVVARALGARLGVPVADLDAWIERDAGCSVQALFAERGESAFRELEHQALRRALDQEAGVVACGGGVVERADNRRLLRERCRTVWLEVTPAQAAARVADERAQRPLLAGGDLAARLTEQLARRAPWYAEVAEVRVAGDAADAELVAEQVLARLGAPA